MEPATTPKTSAGPYGRPAGWLLAFRLVMFCLVVGASLYQGERGSGGYTILWSYFAVTLAFLLFYRRWQDSTWLTLARYTGGLQLFMEVAAEGVLIVHSNVFTSPFVLLFVLTIVSASLQFRLIGTLMVATACSLTVTFATFYVVAGADASAQALKNFSVVLNLNDDLFYALFLYICAFFLAAFVSGYLSEKLELKDRALEGASQALALARLETDDILRHMQSGLLTIDAAGTLVFFNQAAEEILGYRESNITGRHCRDVFSDRMPRIADLLMTTLNHHHSRPRTEVQIPGPEGRTIPLGISTSLLGSPQGGVRGVIAVFQDLTEAKKLEERVRVADRLAAVGELSAGIAHEIRNPLATVTGSVEMLERELHLEGEARSLMDMVLKESARLNTIVEDFLDFARVKQRACHAVDLGALAHEVAGLFERHPARTVEGHIRIDFPRTPVLAAATDEQLKQVLVNLLQNALEALPDGKGEVRISGYAIPVDNDEPQWVEVTVADTGAGIPSKLAEKVGQPFFSTKKHGTGLGVAIVRRLMAAMGGSLQWHSTPGQGASFTVRLPAYSQASYLQEVSELQSPSHV
jgi:two-component system sensor histidine kinase PilS (NtrC family)